MLIRRLWIVLAVVLGMVAGRQAHAQHLWWDVGENRDATCLYGEVTVLASHTAIYYCGANWHPGEPAGGYCGIQHNGPRERRTIFSIWDTTPELHPKVTEADAKTIFNRFGNEGSGAHTHMIWNWKEAETFQFFVRKEAGSEPETVDTRYYVFDREAKRWVHSATIMSPRGGKASVGTFGGGLNSFLENFSGKERGVAKAALYRLWAGKSPETLHCLVRAKGDGTWGQLNQAYFLAEGEETAVAAVFAKYEKEFGKPVFGGRDAKLEPIPERRVPAEVVEELKRLPRSGKVGDGAATPPMR